MGGSIIGIIVGVMGGKEGGVGGNGGRRWVGVKWASTFMGWVGRGARGGWAC